MVCPDKSDNNPGGSYSSINWTNSIIFIFSIVIMTFLYLYETGNLSYSFELPFTIVILGQDITSVALGVIVVIAGLIASFMFRTTNTNGDK